MQRARLLERELHSPGRAIHAYREALAGGTPFDAVIMDLVVPGGMGGRETIRSLLEVDPNARAIVVSGYSNDPIMAEHSSHGFVGCVAKPFRPEELAVVLDRVLGDDPG